ncbi:MAG: CHAT domain-containing protein [Deltaproteobacteria bacterium]|nr:CHAT domain-containing protein [Deltaproteobacteria bacterium]
MEFRSVLQDRRKDPRPAGKRLYDALIRPLEGDLGKPGALLMLSLDGALRYVPAAALWDGNGWLAESRPTVIFTRATAAARDTAAGAPAGGVRARAMGVTRAWPGFPALPGVAAEIEAVVGGKADGSGTGGREVKPAGGVLVGESYLDEAFDRAALASSLASDAPVVHVASHFSLDPTSLEGTALLLGDGGRLSLGEMRSSGDFDFRGLDLLALSACDTGSGARRGETGKEVESLGELLQRAGASAVLATLLPVDDMSAPELVREFYRLRYVEGRDKASALQGAQLKVMRDLGADTAPARGTAVGGRAGAAAESAPAWEGKGFSHPYYWSPFVVMGDWR